LGRRRIAGGLILSRAGRGRSYLDRLRLLLDGAEAVEPSETPRVVPEDPDDDKLVAAALAAGAVLVSNDAHLLAVAGHEGLRVVRPGELSASLGVWRASRKALDRCRVYADNG
jgi:hypothetical protein